MASLRCLHYLIFCNIASIILTCTSHGFWDLFLFYPQFLTMPSYKTSTKIQLILPVTSEAQPSQLMPKVTWSCLVNSSNWLCIGRREVCHFPESLLRSYCAHSFYGFWAKYCVRVDIHNVCVSKTVSYLCTIVATAISVLCKMVYRLVFNVYINSI